ncbi:MAG: rod shape-determining protein MreC [Nitrospirota bacterium]
MLRQKLFYKSLIAAFLAAGLLIFLVAIGIHKKPLQWGESLVGSIIYSVQEGTYSVLSGIKQLSARYFFLVGLSDENPLLKKEIEILKGEVSRLKEKEMLANRLQQLLHFKNTYGFQLIAANVIGREPGPWFQTIMIDRGQADGVLVDMGVVIPTGVVGKVIKSFSHHAQVLLITDKSSAVAAIVQRTRDEGIVQGRGDGRAHLKYLLSVAAPVAGDMLITSGLEGSFAKGMPIGKISKVERPQDSFFLNITVVPVAASQKAEEVFIVLLQKPQFLPTDGQSTSTSVATSTATATLTSTSTATATLTSTSTATSIGSSSRSIRLRPRILVKSVPPSSLLIATTTGTITATTTSTAPPPQEVNPQ